ncbi:MAG: hypothetical protein N2C12_11815 [Planctomycetales bacterium]
MKLSDPVYLGLYLACLLAGSCSCSEENKEPTLKVIQVDGDPGAAIVKDGKICWQALTCKNSDCLLQEPPYFCFPIPGAKLDEGSKIKYPEVTLDTLMKWSTPPCPKCGQAGTVKPYLEPNTEKYMEILKAELKQSRKVRERTFAYEGVRTPVEIMKEMDRLQRSYISIE